VFFILKVYLRKKYPQTGSIPIMAGAILTPAQSLFYCGQVRREFYDIGSALDGGVRVFKTVAVTMQTILAPAKSLPCCLSFNSPARGAR
jgi:hypothetical protein